jgi:hypothetical protein
VSELRPYQAEYVAHQALAPAWYLMGDPRLGKTRAEVCSIVRRIKEKNVRKILIVGPKNPLTLSWEPELRAVGFERPSLGGGELGYLLPMQQTTHKKTAWCAEVLKDLNTGAGSDRPVVALFNFDILERYWNEKKTIKLSDLLCKWAPHDVVVDEGHLIKSASAGRSRALRRLGKRAYFRRILSGTPDPNGPEDFYAQYAFLDEMIFGTRKAAFLDKFFIINPFVNNRVEGVREETRPELEAKAFAIATRWRAKDYFDVVDVPDIVRHLPWSETARKLYDKLAKDSVLREEEDGVTVDGTHLLTKMRRFFQLCEGFLVNESSDELKWYHHSKSAAIVGDLAEILAAGKRCVVSFLHTPDGHNVRDAIAKAYGADVVRFADGSTPNAVESLRLFDINNTTKTPAQVLVVQESVGGEGVSLARAEYLFFSGWSMDGAKHQQMRKRVWDPSRPSSITYFSMPNSADTFRLKVVRDKRNASVMMREVGWFSAINGAGIEAP